MPREYSEVSRNEGRCQLEHVGFSPIKTMCSFSLKRLKGEKLMSADVGQGYPSYVTDWTVPSWPVFRHLFRVITEKKVLGARQFHLNKWMPSLRVLGVLVLISKTWLDHVRGDSQRPVKSEHEGIVESPRPWPGVPRLLVFSFFACLLCASSFSGYSTRHRFTTLQRPLTEGSISSEPSPTPSRSSTLMSYFPRKSTFFCTHRATGTLWR